jgi:hypothetical protein
MTTREQFVWTPAGWKKMVYLLVGGATVGVLLLHPWEAVAPHQVQSVADRSIDGGHSHEEGPAVPGQHQVGHTIVSSGTTTTTTTPGPGQARPWMWDETFKRWRQV